MQLTQVVGNKVRHLREQTGATQDHVARAARDVGLTWGRSSVAQLEAGTRALSAAELILLPLVFLAAFDCELSLTEIVTPMDVDEDGANMVQLTDQASVNRLA
jgi:transcriptional regulator with XRE-family HTH domain